MVVSKELEIFLKNSENQDLINKNTKESWEKIYRGDFPKGFTEILLKSGVNDPAEKLEYIPNYYLYSSNISDYIIPDGVIDIGYAAFGVCRNLKNVWIPKSVMHLCNKVFENTSLISITYEGTKEEAIKCGIGDSSKKHWREDSQVKKIICTNGIIEL